MVPHDPKSELPLVENIFVAPISAKVNKESELIDDHFFPHPMLSAHHGVTKLRRQQLMWKKMDV